MAITNEELDLQEIFSDLGTVCLTEKKCQKCAGKDCMVGYAKYAAAQCRINKQTFVMDGMKNMPPYDIRGGYDEYDVLHAIAHLLQQCRSCKKNHFENCIINVVRSCLEVIEFGDEMEYQGEALPYLMKLSNVNADKAHVIMEEYKLHKEKKLTSQSE